MNSEEEKQLELSVDIEGLHASYMPFIEDGALFVPTDHAFQLEDEVMLTLSLTDLNKKVAFEGRVVWLSPTSVERRKLAGIGVQIQGNNRFKIRQGLEKLLGERLKERPQTCAY